MNIVDTVEKELIVVPVESSDKEGVLNELVDRLCTVKHFSKPGIVEAVMEREALGSTAIGNGVAVPHCKTDLVTGVNLVIGVSPRMISYDKNEVRLFFLVVANENEATSHVKLLSSIARFCSSSVLRNLLASSKTSEEVYMTINN